MEQMTAQASEQSILTTERESYSMDICTWQLHFFLTYNAPILEERVEKKDGGKKIGAPVHAATVTLSKGLSVASP